MDPGLHISVRERLPITVASMRGRLETATLAQAEPVMRECLAQMPSAVVIDAAELKIDPSAHLWLLGLVRSAQRWPGSRVLVTGDHPELDSEVDTYPTLEKALEALGGPDLPERRQLALPPDPSSCARARTLVSEACDDWGIRRTRRLAELLISELVANGVMHAGTQLNVTVRKKDGALELSVRDHGTGALPTEHDMRDPKGFGLQLLAALSDTWGWSPAGRGKVVWARLEGVA